MHEVGGQARDALLRLLGEHQQQLEELLNLLTAKGVITDSEWEAAMGRRDREGPSKAEWARRCMEPKEYGALSTVFDAAAEAGRGGGSSA